VIALGAALGTVAVGAWAHGAFHRNSPLFGRVQVRVGDGSPVVALTFDDGPNPDATPRILDALGELGVHATFFVLGRHVLRWPELVRRAVAEGHLVANHGHHHRKLHLRTPSFVRRDLELGTAAIVDAAGVRPRYFRAPHGFRAPWVTPIARALGQTTVGWSLGVWDSDRPGVDAIVERTALGARAGSILLLHDGDGYDPAGDRRQTAAAVPTIVQRLRDRGLRFVTVDA
jgi:peptidoglycan/xylan/chitin deacetylase (PgdA/CDA1 family)